MAKLLLNLRYVPEDEYQEVCELLTEQDIEFYETSAGFFGIGVAGIWLQKDEDEDQAKSLLKEYMEKRYESAQTEYQNAMAEGSQRTWWQTIKQQPVSVVMIFIAILLLLLLTVGPFVAI